MSANFFKLPQISKIFQKKLLGRKPHTVQIHVVEWSTVFLSVPPAHTDKHLVLTKCPQSRFVHLVRYQQVLVFDYRTEMESII